MLPGDTSRLNYRRVCHHDVDHWAKDRDTKGAMITSEQPQTILVFGPKRREVEFKASGSLKDPPYRRTLFEQSSALRN